MGSGENFPEIFDSILYKLADSQGRFGGEYIQPVELTRFICKLADVPSNGKIYNPFAGLASFAVFFDQGQHYLGQEINYKTWALGILRIMAYERVGRSIYIADDSIKNWNPKSEKYDLIVANPPFAFRLPKPIDSEFGTITNYGQFLVGKGIADLSENGKLIALIPNGFLYHSGSEFNIRKFLVDQDILEMVISFPGGLLSNTGIPIALLLINKAKKNKGIIRFVNASRFTETTFTKNKKLNDYSLNSTISGDADSDSLRIVSLADINSFNYNLNVKRYFQKAIEGISLDNIVTRVKTERVKANVSGKFIRLRDLKDDRLNYTLDYGNVETTIIPSRALKISESVLLLAIRWKTLKPTYFNYDGNPIYISHDMIPFRINREKTDIDFLVYELHSEFITDQLHTLRVGETIPMIRFEDLMTVKIQLPSIESQKAKVQGAKDAFMEIKTRELKEEATKYGLDKRLFSEFASLKHTLGSPLQNILSNASVLLRYFGDRKIESSQLANDDFKNRLNENLVEIIRSIKNDTNLISDLLEKGENAFDFSNYDIGIWDLSEIEKEILKLRNARFKFRLSVNLIKVPHKNSFGIWGNPRPLQIMINNILDNADKHAFDEKSPENHVVVDLSILEEEFIVQIKNNEKPFPKGYNKEKFITKYVTSDPQKGSGIGGYDINRIAEFFRAPWDLILNDDKLFPVEFKFYFPLVANT